MRKTLGIVAVLALVVPAVLAGPIRPATENLPTVQAQVAGDVVGGSRAITFCYDNWTSPPSGLTGLVLAGTDEIADDLTVVGPAGAGLLSNVGINVANANGPTGSQLTGGSVAVRFYRLDTGAYIGGFNGNLPALTLAPGGSIRLSFGDGALDSFGITIPTVGVYMSLQATVTGTGGFAAANAGFQTRGPVGIGSSTDAMVNVTTNQTFNFGGNPIANGGLFIKTNDVPEPASLLLIAAGLLVVRRR